MKTKSTKLFYIFTKVPSRVILILATSMLIYAYSFGQVTFTPTITPAHCGLDDGSISIDISNCSLANIYVWQFIGTSPGSTINITPFTPNVLPIVFNNLPIGFYYVLISACGINYEHTFEITDIDSYWPIIPLNSLRAFCIDIKNDNQHDVIASGWWDGVINLFPAGIVPDLVSPGGTRVFLVKYNQCGRFIWQCMLDGPPEMSCKVNAIDITRSQEIVMSGDFSNGKLTFPGPGGISLVNNAAFNAGFVAKFNIANGNCIWAAKIDGIQRPVQAKDIVSDDQENIFVMGDYFGPNAVFYNATGGPPAYSISNLAPSLSDNFLAVYNSYGVVIQAIDNFHLSSVDNDYSGGLCCVRNTFNGNTITEIILTGVKQYPGTMQFMGQRWFFMNNQLNWQTDFQLNTAPLGTYFGMGMNVDYWLDANNGKYMFVFSGYEETTPGSPFPIPSFKGHPFIASVTSPYPWPNAPLPIENTSDYYDFVNPNPSFQNYASNVAINKSSGDIKIGGIVKDDGPHPLTSGMSVPGLPQGVFYVDHFPPDVVNTQIGNITSNLFSVSGTMISDLNPQFYDEGYVGLCADNNYQSFVSGSYTGGLISPPGLNIPWNGNTSYFIARILDTPNGIKIKNKPIEPANISAVSVGLEVSIFPNPATNEFRVKVLNSTCKIDKIEVFSYTGQLINTIQTLQNSDMTYLLNVESLPAGMYMLKVISKDAVAMKKLVIQ